MRALFLLFMGIWLWGCEPRPLQIFLIDCAALHQNEAEPSCDLNEDHSLRLLVITVPSSRVSVWSGGSELVLTEIRSASEEKLFGLQVPPHATSLEIRSREGWFQRHAVRLTVRERAAHEAPWLTQARELLEVKSQPAAAELLLRQHLQDPGPVEWRALQLGLLADIAMEGNRRDSMELLDRAIAASMQANLPSIAIQHILRKSWLLSQRWHKFPEAEELLRENQSLFAALPETRAWELSQRALMRRAQGDLRGALALLAQAEASADRFANESARAEVLSQRATTLVMMGRIQEAVDYFATLSKSVSQPCRLGLLRATQGYTFIQARQALHPDDRLWIQLKPERYLEEAVEILRACRMPHALANALTNLAHAAAAAEKVEETERWLEEARRVLPQPDTELELEWTELTGKLSLWRRSWEAASERYKRLARLGMQQDQYESGWLARIGQAHAEEERDQFQARTLYQSAEDYLDQRSLELPLGAGRGSFLGRFERGTARYLDLLVRAGLLTEAVRVVRHARARGLWALGLLVRADALSPTERQRWEKALAAYRLARRELDEIIAEAAEDAEGPRRSLEREQQERVRNLLGLLESSLHLLGAAAESKSFREPDPREAMLTCHPGAVQTWHCFVWDQKGLRHLTLERMDALHLGPALLKVRDMMAGNERLTVIAYGELRRIDVHHLPWPGAVGGQLQQLGDTLSVVYALDLPWRNPSTEGGPKSALLLFDSQGRLPHTRRVVAPAAQALRAAGWEILAQSVGTMSLGEYEGRQHEDAPRLSGERLRGLLSQAGLFHFGGHGDYEPVGGWGHRLRTADGQGLLVGDILMLPLVPRRVLLFGCNTGQSAEESGSVEGLGLAQAFLLRGSAWVIATVHEVSDRVAADVAVRLYADQMGPHGIMDESPDPAAALWKVERKLKALSKDPQLLQDLAAFRVFVP